MNKIEGYKELYRDLRNRIASFEKNKDYYKWRRSDALRLGQFHNIHKGKDCFIIGNGPSLNRMDLSLLNDYYTFGLNKINLIFEKVKFDLSYHVTVNPLVIEQSKNDIEKNVFNCPSFVSYFASKEILDDSPNVFKLITNAKWSFYQNIREPICEGYTVTYVAMQIAFYMGFENVFLVGVDHNFNQKGKPNQEQVLNEEDSNHFHPDYFRGMKWHLADLEGNEASYALAKHQYHKNGREIYDATIDGKLQIFRKLSFPQALEKAKKKEE